MLLENNRILKIFLENPTREFHLRELARISGVSTTAVSAETERLVDKNLISRRKDGLYTVFKANSDDREFKDRKKFYTFLSLQKSGLLAYLEDVYRYPAIVLFGSCSRGEDAEGSDIDLFILTAEKKQANLSAFEKKLGRKVNLLVITEKDLEAAKKKNKELVNNIINGMVISGYLKVL